MQQATNTIQQVPRRRPAGIPRPLYRQLVDVLLHCGPFDSQEDLENIFVQAPINVWRSMLPEADTEQKRVEAVVAFLWKRETAGHENGLLAFLHVLQDGVEDGCARPLQEAVAALQAELAAAPATTLQPEPAVPPVQKPPPPPRAGDEITSPPFKTSDLPGFPQPAQETGRRPTLPSRWDPMAAALGAVFVMLLLLLTLLLPRPTPAEVGRSIPAALRVKPYPARLETTVSVWPETAGAGEPLTYLLTVRNTGNELAQGVVLTDTLPAGTTPQSIANCAWDEETGVVVCRPEELGPNEAQTYRLTVQVHSSARGSLVNELSVTHQDAIEPLRRFTRTWLRARATLGVTLLPAPESLFLGDEVAYTLHVTNDGPADATALQATFQLPAGAMLMRRPDYCTPQETDVLVCTLGTLPIHYAATTALVLAPANVGEVTLAVEVQGAESETVTAGASSQVHLRTGLHLSLASPEVAEGAFLTGETLTFRLHGVNNTNREARNVQLYYELPASGVELVPSTSSCSSTLVDDSLVRCDVGTLPAGGEAWLEIRVRPLAAGGTRHRFRLAAEGFAEQPLEYSLVAVARLVCPQGCPFSSIQEAIDASKDNDIIGIGAGRYVENVTINKSIVLVGSRTGETIVDGGAAGRVFTLPAGDSIIVLNRLVITNGLATVDPRVTGPDGAPGPWGGGIWNGGRLVLNFCRVLDNVAGSGGHGADADPAAGTAAGHGGNGGHGGGIYNEGTLVLADTEITGNRAGDGGNGGAGATDLSPGNGGSGGEGGGIYNAGILQWGRNVRVENNQAGQGGLGGAPLDGGAAGAPGPAGLAADVYCGNACPQALLGTSAFRTGSPLKTASPYPHPPALKI